MKRSGLTDDQTLELARLTIVLDDPGVEVEFVVSPPGGCLFCYSVGGEAVHRLCWPDGHLELGLTHFAEQAF